MAAPVPPFPLSALLYHSPPTLTTLIDIPYSISLAQSHPSFPPPNPAALLSTPPLQTPYPSTEPKTAAARARVLERMDPEERGADDEAVAEVIAGALAEVRAKHTGAWCLRRSLSTAQPARRSRKRKLGMGAGAEVGTTEPSIPVSANEAQISGPLEPLQLSSESTIAASALANRLIRNPHPTATHLRLPPTALPYTIPPHSAFYLSTITPQFAAAFAAAASALHPTRTSTAGPGQFDFILLDPPWANRSVRRSRSYQTSEAEETDPLDALQGMLGRHIPRHGLVGCWVTNKAASKRQALEAFRAWDVGLVEQWVWVKTTVSGEPVTAVDGVWRKPYEILLLGRRSGREEEGGEVGEAPGRGGVVRRVILGVPDLHSRKPCLKELVAPMMEDRGTYRGLEIFARNLTAGYCAWGDEVLRFNWGGHWSKVDVADVGSAYLHTPESG